MIFFYGFSRLRFQGLAQLSIVFLAPEAQNIKYPKSPQDKGAKDTLTMPLPVALATVAACGSIVTSIKSGWELRRMIKRKQEAKECDEEAPYVFRRLRRAYYDGIMSVQEYEQWYEKFLVAKVDKDRELPSQTYAVCEPGAS